MSTGAMLQTGRLFILWTSLYNGLFPLTDASVGDIVFSTVEKCALKATDHFCHAAGQKSLAYLISREGTKFHATPGTRHHLSEMSKHKKVMCVDKVRHLSRGTVEEGLPRASFFHVHQFSRRNKSFKFWQANVQAKVSTRLHVMYWASDMLQHTWAPPR